MTVSSPAIWPAARCADCRLATHCAKMSSPSLSSSSSSGSDHGAVPLRGVPPCERTSLMGESRAAARGGEPSGAVDGRSCCGGIFSAFFAGGFFGLIVTDGGAVDGRGWCALSLVTPILLMPTRGSEFVCLPTAVKVGLGSGFGFSLSPSRPRGAAEPKAGRGFALPPRS